MAIRRMFSSRVTESTRFLRMPATSQNLYFHLGMNADDDGVVEAYPVMRTIGATEDDLRVIVSKGFATILNDDMVTFLNDWLENNNIRADRKLDSIYKDLLLEIVPDAQLKESKPTYYSRTKSICQTNDNHLTTICQPFVGIDKDRLGKDSIENNLCASDDLHDTKNADVESFFESIWKLYPNKKGKGQVSKSKKKILFDIGYDEMCRAIDRYKEGLQKDEWRKPQNGSTFFNSGYVDYLDSNYKDQECVDDAAIYKTDLTDEEREILMSWEVPDNAPFK